MALRHLGLSSIYAGLSLLFRKSGCIQWLYGGGKIKSSLRLVVEGVHGDLMTSSKQQHFPLLLVVRLRQCCPGTIRVHWRRRYSTSLTSAQYELYCWFLKFHSDIVNIHTLWSKELRTFRRASLLTSCWHWTSRNHYFWSLCYLQGHYLPSLAHHRLCVACCPPAEPVYHISAHR